MKKNNKGFTLAELLIVVAIIAVLVAVAIPVFTTQLERSKQATDAANIRAAYAEAVTNALSAANGEGTATTQNAMKSSGWDKLTDAPVIGNTSVGNISKTVDKKITVTVSGDSVGFAVAN